ncbi:DUF2087 domain-containing protein [Steroidobacter sp. S1-65]|uniref:DUF2087 domain-containing protein n=1 Tax=Steroidobacter gossypii TaxID=2805490 RepID=A0ABS1WZG1_9GAMM|nr:DUF2087 domain-containing protein [Steroidobacter gossypii]MBM0106317.1 DUF2087 domain-containing protein [Steroidobacter gossypii]
MSRVALSLQIPDLSGFARSLREQLGKRPEPPGHVEMLNLLCRSAGFRNYQHCKGVMEARQRLDAPVQAEPTVDYELLEKAVRLFDAQGRLLRWPTRAGLQDLCLWVMWSRVPSRTGLTEKQISELIKRWHAFGDHALLRRALIGWRLVHRTVDGSEYRRIEQKPPAELSPLLARLSGRA